MKKLILILSVFLLFSCNKEYEVISTKIIKGRISSIEKGTVGGTYIPAVLPKIYVQDTKSTIEINIPFANENDYKIGDSISVIVQQVIEKN